MPESSPVKLGLIATHPIQYQIPWFRELARHPELDLLVYFVMMPTPEQQGVGFAQAFSWDIPLVEGYAWKQLDNHARHPSMGNFWGCRIANFSRQLKNDGINVLLVTGWNSLALLQAAWTARRVGIPVIVRGDSNGLRQRPLWTRGLHRLLLKLFDKFLFVGQANRQFYLKNGVLKRNLFPCLHFVENQRFHEAVQVLKSERQHLRQQWRIKQNSVCFLFCAKFIEKKRPIDLIRAFAKACRYNSQLHLLMVGTGELLAFTKQFAQAQHLPVTFAGFLNQSEIVRAYVVADCLALPSDYGETWGLVVNEAMACGLPALVSDRVGCGEDLIQSGVTGELFEFGDIDDLSNKLLTLADNLPHLQAMGEQAQALVSEQYSVEQAVTGTWQAIQHVAIRK